jgi:site-specific recombinase XerD
MPTIRSTMQGFREYLQRRNYAAHTVDSYLLALMLDSRVLRDQKLNKRVKQRFASLSDVVHKLKATQVKRELLL